MVWQVSGGECSSYKEQLCKGPTAGWCLVCFHDKKMGHRLTHTHTHTHNVHTDTHTHIHRYTQRYTHTHTHICTDTHTHIYRDTYVHIHTHIDTRTPTHVHTHTQGDGPQAHTHTQTHTYTAQPGARLRGSACPPPGHTSPGKPAHLKHDPGFLEQVLGGYGTRDHAPGWVGTVRVRAVPGTVHTDPAGSFTSPLTLPERSPQTSRSGWSCRS